MIGLGIAILVVSAAFLTGLLIRTVQHRTEPYHKWFVVGWFAWLVLGIVTVVRYWR